LGASINEGFRYVGQTYVAGASGSLTAIGLGIRSKRSMNPERDFPRYAMCVTIYSVDDRQISNALIAFVLSDDELPPDTVVTLPKTISQVKGHKYAIVVHYPDAPSPGPGRWIANWSGMSGDTYQKGEMLTSKDGHTWQFKQHDLLFKTFLAGCDTKQANAPPHSEKTVVCTTDGETKRWEKQQEMFHGQVTELPVDLPAVDDAGEVRKQRIKKTVVRGANSDDGASREQLLIQNKLLRSELSTLKKHYRALTYGGYRGKYYLADDRWYPATRRKNIQVIEFPIVLQSNPAERCGEDIALTLRRTPGENAKVRIIVSGDLSKQVPVDERNRFESSDVDLGVVVKRRDGPVPAGFVATARKLTEERQQIVFDIPPQSEHEHFFYLCVYLRYTCPKATIHRIDLEGCRFTQQVRSNSTDLSQGIFDVHDKLVYKRYSRRLASSVIKFEPRMRFSELDRPATKTDVELGKAIFTFDGLGEARASQLRRSRFRGNAISETRRFVLPIPMKLSRCLL